MSAPPPSPTATLSEQDVHAAVQRLAAIDPGPYWVVTCYLKLEPRDRTRGKYLIKMKNRVKESAAALARQSLGHADREAIAADLQRVLDYLEEPNHLPSTRAIAIFASQGLDLFETLPLPTCIGPAWPSSTSRWCASSSRLMKSSERSWWWCTTALQPDSSRSPRTTPWSSPTFRPWTPRARANSMAHSSDR